MKMINLKTQQRRLVAGISPPPPLLRLIRHCSYIVGITDPTLLLDLRGFNLLIALSPKREISETQEFSPELLRKTEKRASFSGKMTGANKNLTMEDMEQEVLLVAPLSSLSSPQFFAEI
jgi:hypothetical protein